MFSSDEILKRLQNGDTSETIAQEMAQALNDAIATKEKIEKEAELKRLNEQKRAAEKAMACQEIADRLNWLIDNYYDYNAHITTQDIADMLDSVSTIHDLFGDISNILFNPKSLNTSKDDRSPDDIIADFIAKLDL